MPCDWAMVTVTAPGPQGQVLLAAALICFACAVVLSISLGFGEWKRERRERMLDDGFSQQDVDAILPLRDHWS